MGRPSGFKSIQEARRHLLPGATVLRRAVGKAGDLDGMVAGGGERGNTTDGAPRKAWLLLGEEVGHITLKL